MGSNFHFGEHLTIDGYKGDSEKLNDCDLVRKCLVELPSMFQMKALADPVVYSAPDNGMKDPGGWSGFVVIAESHISIHTFPARGFVSIDVYTCKNGLAVNNIVDYFVREFSLEKTEVNLLERGKEYPEHNLV